MLQTPAHGSCMHLRAPLNEGTHHPHHPATGLYWVPTNTSGAELHHLSPTQPSTFLPPKMLSPTKKQQNANAHLAKP